MSEGQAGGRRLIDRCENVHEAQIDRRENA